MSLEHMMISIMLRHNDTVHIHSRGSLGFDYFFHYYYYFLTPFAAVPTTAESTTTEATVPTVPPTVALPPVARENGVKVTLAGLTTETVREQGIVH